jgi:peptidoglycan/LPS O-acetylase OafA/YrhL
VLNISTTVMNCLVPSEVAKPNWSLLAGLRFALACIVVFYHTSYLIWPMGWMPKLGWHFGGFAAVFGFLLISGFSIAHSIHKESKGFYARRFERLAPTYYLSFFFGVAVYGLFFFYTSPDTAEWPSMSEDPWQWAVSCLMLGGILAIPLPLMGPAWSLGAEICYYAVAPFLKRLPLKALAALGVSSVVFYVYTGLTSGNNFPSWFGLTTIGCLFWPWLAGWLFYHYRYSSLCWPGLVVVLALFGEASGRTADGNLITIAVVGAALIEGHRLIFSRSVARVLDYLGDVSFPLYLSHYPAIYFAKFLLAKSLLPNYTTAIMAVVFASAAAITFIAQARSTLLARSKNRAVTTVQAEAIPEAAVA